MFFLQLILYLSSSTCQYHWLFHFYKFFKNKSKFLFCNIPLLGLIWLCNRSWRTAKNKWYHSLEYLFLINPDGNNFSSVLLVFSLVTSLMASVRFGFFDIFTWIVFYLFDLILSVKFPVLHAVCFSVFFFLLRNC